MKLLTTALICSSLVLTSFGAQSKAAFGAGVAYVFGDGFAISIKVFSDDEEDKVAASLGLDFIVKDTAFRPNIGVAYLGRNFYADVSAGYSFGDEEFNAALGAGWANTQEEEKSNTTTPATVATAADNDPDTDPDPDPIIDTDIDTDLPT